MRNEWLIDLVAIIENESLNRAAEKRFISQPAFSRRIKIIEQNIGIELLDRTKKPAQLKPWVKKYKKDIYNIISNTNELIQNFKQSDKESTERIIIAGQHAITTSIAPQLIDHILKKLNAIIKLRSANHSECYALLTMRQAHIMLAYDTVPEDNFYHQQDNYLHRCELGSDSLIPVCSAAYLNSFKEQLQHGKINIIAYPKGVFFNMIMETKIFPTIQTKLLVNKNIETALTLVAMQFALNSMNVAWIPHSLAQPELKRKNLINLKAYLPTANLFIVALCLKDDKSDIKNKFWKMMTTKDTIKLNF